jgi:hypothetical protein
VPRTRLQRPALKLNSQAQKSKQVFTQVATNDVPSSTTLTTGGKQSVIVVLQLHTIHGVLFDGRRLHADQHLALEGLEVGVHGQRNIERILKVFLRGNLQDAGGC